MSAQMNCMAVQALMMAGKNLTSAYKCLNIDYKALKTTDYSLMIADTMIYNQALMIAGVSLNTVDLIADKRLNIPGLAFASNFA